MTLNEVASRAKSQISEITGLRPISVSGIFKDENGWHVAVDLLEMSRIPSSTDLLGEYDVLLDDNGAVLRFERKRTHLRCEALLV